LAANFLFYTVAGMPWSRDANSFFSTGARGRLHILKTVLDCNRGLTVIVLFHSDRAAMPRCALTFGIENDKYKMFLLD